MFHHADRHMIDTLMLLIEKIPFMVFFETLSRIALHEASHSLPNEVRVVQDVAMTTLIPYGGAKCLKKAFYAFQVPGNQTPTSFNQSNSRFDTLVISCKFQIFTRNFLLAVDGVNHCSFSHISAQIRPTVNNT
jgi:hypothetical protein